MAMAQYDATGASSGTPPVSTPAAPTLPPGIGNAAQVNQANQFMRAQPWYQDFLKQNGQNLNKVNLTKDQAYALLQLARQKGIGISTKYSLDSSGNIVSDGMPGWEKAVIAAGIVVAGIYLAPAVISALGGAGPASSAATAAAAGDTAAAATLTSAGVEAGAISGLGAAALPGAGTALGGAGAAIGAGAATAAAPVAASALGPTSATTMGATNAALTAAPPAALSTGLGPVAPAAAGGLGTDLLHYAVPTAGNIIGGIIQAHTASEGQDAQQAYLQEALDYEKQRDAAAIALEGSRYATYSGNIAPYLASGNSANARMTGLLGLPASPTTTAPSVSYSPSATSTGTSQPTAAVTTGAPLPRATDTGAPVMMRAPDGSTKQVSPDQVAHYQSLGAQVIG